MWNVSCQENKNGKKKNLIISESARASLTNKNSLRLSQVLVEVRRRTRLAAAVIVADLD